jgi:uncharacterized protein YeaO (DUF488 family)
MSRIAASRVRLKRPYEPPAASDGTRVLIDRLWPRGVRKDAAALDLWLKDIGPSTELRKWFGHEPSRWAEFRRRYADEIAQKPQLLPQLRDIARQGVLTMVYSAHDEQHNDALVLQELILHPPTATGP